MFSIRCTSSVLPSLFTSIIKIKQITSVKFHRRKGYHRGVTFYFKKLLFKKYLLLTNSVTSGLCMAIGDLVEQEVEYQKQKLSYRYDWMRTARMFSVGTVMGPVHHYYYVYLDKKLPKVDVKTVIVKIICDQIFASPLTILSFFFAMGLLENKTLLECISELKTKFLYVYMGDCLYWPPVQFINFYFLSTAYRVLFVNVATMVYNIFLSYMKHYDK